MRYHKHNACKSQQTESKRWFQMTNIEMFINTLKTIGNKGKTLAYLIENKDPENRLDIEVAQLAKIVGISRISMASYLNEFECLDVLKRTKGKIMINPIFMAFGDSERINRLLYRYNNFGKLPHEMKIENIRKEENTNAI